MIPILYEKDETQFISNGLGRLYDVTACTVTEERNGVYECDFEMPVNGAHFSDVVPGRIIGVTHDQTGDVQPFDIVSFTRPINGVVTFHAVHISYRLSKAVVIGSDINSLQEAFDLLATATPSGGFTFSTDQGDEAGYVAAADGTPRTVRQLLGGVEGSILDTYRGEFEFNKFAVVLWSERGTLRDFAIRYGVNMAEYNEDVDYLETYNAAVPFWRGNGSGGDAVVVVGDVVRLSGESYNGREECVPLDMKDKFQTQPTQTQLQEAALRLIQDANKPKQSIDVSFVQLADSPEYAEFAPLLSCQLCDRIPVYFPYYGIAATYKIVKTVYNVLLDRFDSMELGTLSTSLAAALGVSTGLNGSGSGSGGGGDALNAYPVGSYYETSDGTFNPNEWGGTWTDTAIVNDHITSEGVNGSWTYRKWSSGKIEAWGNVTVGQIACTTAGNPFGGYRSAVLSIAIPSGIFSGAPSVVMSKDGSQGGYLSYVHGQSATAIQYIVGAGSSITLANQAFSIYAFTGGTNPGTIHRWHRTG